MAAAARGNGAPVGPLGLTPQLGPSPAASRCHGCRPTLRSRWAPALPWASSLWTPCSLTGHGVNNLAAPWEPGILPKLSFIRPSIHPPIQELLAECLSCRAPQGPLSLRTPQSPSPPPCKHPAHRYALFGLAMIFKVLISYKTQVSFWKTGTF